MKSALSIEAKHEFGLQEEKTTASSSKLCGHWKVFDFLILLFHALEKQQTQFSLCFFVQVVFLN